MKDPRPIASPREPLGRSGRRLDLLALRGHQLEPHLDQGPDLDLVHVTAQGAMGGREDHVADQVRAAPDPCELRPGNPIGSVPHAFNDLRMTALCFGGILTRESG